MVEELPLLLSTDGWMKDFGSMSYKDGPVNSPVTNGGSHLVLVVYDSWGRVTSSRHSPTLRSESLEEKT